jgi:nucleotidyltransferase substrate binding protein (TIGR01987 family)
MSAEIRWKQRFQSFENALLKLREALALPLGSLSELEEEGIIQRFEYTFELAWKMLKDYLLYSGVALDPITPRNVIKQAFAAGVIKNGQQWIDMLDHRNLMSHTYSRASFEAAIAAIRKSYGPVLEETYQSLKGNSQV